ncbi:PEPxxWA-CTERM sorting domain-containing protein [Sphingomonas sp. AP4-R1]|uniref:PEPxxWA-CTERM sorting domain-containing protein n=1 Tax=Sphingomonas sp. AP4-R1 TaxID=2735134 RepID=UPI0020A438D4|nr:PEPxxWA-CTERM sorting domain-containing protein [Sphingomonas sp. AP4-R1]
MRLMTKAAFASLLFASVPAFAATFDTGNLVVLVEGNGVYGATSGSYTTNQAAPITLMQFAQTGTSSASYVNSLVLPQTTSGANLGVSGEYGSSSEGFLHLSGDGKSLTLMGYGVNAAAFNANPTAYGTLTTDPTKSTALAQSGSLTGQAYTAVPRVVVSIDAMGSVNSSTALYNVYNGQNPRAAYTVDGSSYYISGQGQSGDKTGGVFYVSGGTATAVTGLDTSGKTAAQDTRDVQVYNGQLLTSVDSKQGSKSNRDFIGTLGQIGSLPTSLANNGDGPTMLPGFGNNGGTGKLTVTAANSNGLNTIGTTVNLSPEAFFFANPTTLYVADSGMPKNDSVTNDSNGSSLGNGGLQKWVFSNGSWSLAYTIAAGLNLVGNGSASGVTGLFGLTGVVVGDTVELYATSNTVTGVETTYLYGISDTLTATTKAAGQSFTTLATSPINSVFRGISFAPTASDVPEPASWALFIVGFGAVGGAMRRRTRTNVRFV